MQNAKFTDSFSKVSESVGVYYPLGRIIVEQGGWCDPSAVIAGKKYVAKCILLGK